MRHRFSYDNHITVLNTKILAYPSRKFSPPDAAGKFSIDLTPSRKCLLASDHAINCIISTNLPINPMSILRLET
jgi:hypothetical protein